MEDRREAGEDHAFLRLLQTVLAGVVLVVSVQRFRRHVVLSIREWSVGDLRQSMESHLERLVDVPFAFHAQLDVVEGFRARRRVVDVLAFDERDHFAGEEARHGALDARALHFALQLVEQDAQELLTLASVG